jgi:hypothetical protein
MRLTYLKAAVPLALALCMETAGGVDVLLDKTFGSVTFNTRAFYGRASLSAPTFPASLRRFAGVNLSATMGPLTLRIGGDRGSACHRLCLLKEVTS